MVKRVCIAVTSTATKGDTGEATGYYLSEVSHPWHVLRKAGYGVDFISTLGGTAPAEGVDLDDPINAAFWNNAIYRGKIDHTLRPKAIHPEEYEALFFAGGHGAMWDFPDDADLAALTRAIYEQGGVVGAVCHGPAALVNVRLSDGNYLVAGKKVNSFTNAEECAVSMETIVPFMLETRLKERGALFENSALWQPHVTVDQRLVTGQNPQSAMGVAEAMVALMHKEPSL